MIYFCIGIAILAVLYFGLWWSSAGKFWHQHEWYAAYEHQAPSIALYDCTMKVRK